MNGFIDTHAHLVMDTYNGDREDMIQRARDGGVSRIISVGSGDRFEENSATVELARSQAGLFAVVGSHPHRAAVTDPDEVAALERLASAPEVVAIGETGLDYHYLNSPEAAQRDRFRVFIDMARRLGKPLVVHSREAESETLAILREEDARSVGGVIHCFTGSYPFARECLDLGFYLSFTGVITFKKTEALRDVVRQVPVDRILSETDAPYLAPEPFRGRRNEPAHVVKVTETLAGLKGLTVEETVQIVNRNADRCYRLEAAA